MNDDAKLDSQGAVSPEMRHASHEKEVSALRELVAQQLQQIEYLQGRNAGTHKLENHVVQLREANEHLVLATFSAQDRQADAEQATRRQSEFLAMLSHELRNPLQPIAHANELLGKLGAVAPELPKLQAIISRQVTHMVRLVDDLLDASRVSNGKITLERSPLTLADIVAAAVEASQTLLDKRGQQLHVILPHSEVRLDGDLIRLAQVLSNLLSNASKFSPESESIILQAQVQGPMVRISVRDHGIGIPAELQPLVFDLFTQGARALDRAQGGLGIGLTLVRTLVELHGGTVEVRSDGIGLGSEFIVLLPLSVARKPAPVRTPAPVAGGAARSILLIEDNVDASDTMRVLLELRGHHVTQCYDGISALACAMAQHYDVILCDIGLPGMDGFAVIEGIRAKTGGRAPYVIATSGYNQPQDLARAVHSGFDQFLVKPVAIDGLLALIESHVSQ